VCKLTAKMHLFYAIYYFFTWWYSILQSIYKQTFFKITWNQYAICKDYNDTHFLKKMCIFVVLINRTLLFDLVYHSQSSNSPLTSNFEWNMIFFCCWTAVSIQSDPSDPSVFLCVKRLPFPLWECFHTLDSNASMCNAVIVDRISSCTLHESMTDYPRWEVLTVLAPSFKVIQGMPDWKCRFFWSDGNGTADRVVISLSLNYICNPAP